MPPCYWPTVHWLARTHTSHALPATIYLKLLNQKAFDKKIHAIENRKTRCVSVMLATLLTIGLTVRTYDIDRDNERGHGHGLWGLTAGG